MKFRIISLFAFASLLFAAVACTQKIPAPETGDGDLEEELDEQEENIRFYVNSALYNIMDVYYLWVDEVKEEMDTWTTVDDPVTKVRKVRYKDSEGNDIDRWTEAIEDFESFSSSVEGVSTTYGYDFSLYYLDEAGKYVCAVVTYTSADSPARKAGLKRGDVIVSANGKSFTADDYADVVNKEMLSSSSCSLELSDGTKVAMTAVKMYEEPVLLHKTFDCAGKKVGYIVFNKFTEDAAGTLMEACRNLKAEGIRELILDLRYNTGGHVSTEEVLASMLAPASAMGQVFETTVYNSLLATALGNGASRLSAVHKDSKGRILYDTSDLNLGITKLYAIMTGSSASASESLLVGLGPYLDIEIIGQQSYGKYCSGILYDAADWYEENKKELKSEFYKDGKEYAENWGIYVMIGRFADKDGNTPCMPDGFKPDIEVEDCPYEPYELGDEREAMLYTALRSAGKTDLPSPRTPSTKSSGSSMEKVPWEKPDPASGLRILQRPSLNL